MLIVLDGPAGVGKSTVAKRLADKLLCDHFDTGAMYRAATFFLLENKCSFNDEIGVKNLLKKFNFEIFSKDNQKRYIVNGQDVSEQIRSLEVTAAVSAVASKGFIRHELVKIQRKYAQQKREAIFEGRDMGTVVFPNADLKFYLTAKPEIRAKRRVDELHQKGEEVSFEKILEGIKARDKADMTREISPLCQAKDAIVVDTSHLSIDQVIDRLYSYYQKKLKRTFPRFFKMKPFYAVVVFFFWCWLKLFYRLKTYNSQNFIKGRAIIASNHISYLDPPVVSVSALEEVHFLAKSELFKIPIFGFLIRKLNSHPVASSGGDASTFKRILSLLKQEQKIVLFPEGERTLDGKLGPILPGVGFLAYLATSPIIPCYIHGAYQVWPRQKKFPKPFGKIKLAFGKPIFPGEFSHLEKKEAIEQISNRLESALKELEAFLK